MLKKVGKRHFAILFGKITNDSCSATIKKLALLNTEFASWSRGQKNAGPGRQPANRGFVQIVPTRLCAGEMHVLAALEHAISAIDKGTAFSHKPELEFLIRFFGNKQLTQCLEAAKFREGEELVLVVEASGGKNAVGVSRKLGFVEQEFDFSKNRAELMRFYGITRQELDTLSDLSNALEEVLVEKISFVALEK